MSGYGDQGQPRARPGRKRWMLAAGTLGVAVGLGAYSLAGTGGGATRPQRAVVASRAQPSDPTAPAPVAPDGTYTTPSGATATIASLRGTPTMVWFVAGGCASCAASIPAVATHFRQLARSRLRVVTLGLYGDFPPGQAGVAQLLSFGKSAAGSAGASITQPGWLWGMASKSLSLAYDPSGTPDQYVLIGPRGHIRYRNSVPDSTMPQLLAATARLTGLHLPASHRSPATSVATLP